MKTTPIYAANRSVSGPVWFYLTNKEPTPLGQSISSKRRILLLGDHPLVREHLAAVIDFQPDLMVCGQVVDGAFTMAAIEQTKPELVVVELSPRDGDEFDVLDSIKSLHPLVAVLAISLHDEEAYAELCRKAGAAAHVSKHRPTDEILNVIRTILRIEPEPRTR